MTRRLLCFLIAWAGSFLFAQTGFDLSYYLPAFTVEDEGVPTPKDVILHEVGEWHISHDKLAQYAHAVADASDRVSLISMGRSHEGREQILLVITSAQNQTRLEEIRQNHLQLTDPEQSSDLDLSDMPVVIWQGYSIHGNESSGANAALALMYYYAAGGDAQLKDQLDHAIILLDPCFNPDGLTRFASWANSTRSTNLVADPQNREQNEPWPGGRTNHYWFDLNRDWLPVQQPESQNRIRQYHRWKPNILTDHHEMGTNSTFFFQPGIPSRNNPNTPTENFDLTVEIGTYHAKALDEIGSLYFSQESFDDFYYGKGSTFPDINGGIGILFEQASSRGHLQESDNGLMSFPFTIRNQARTSLSTLEAGVEMREKLLDYQRRFYQESQEEGQAASPQTILVGGAGDVNRTLAFKSILRQHGIKTQRLTASFTTAGTTFEPNSSFAIPLNQATYRLINIMFEQPTSFQDSLFYDVSAWTLPLAFNLDYAYTDDAPLEEDGETNLKTELARSNYAYAIRWNDYYSPYLLNWLQTKGVRTKAVMTTFTYEGEDYLPGTILIALQSQDMPEEEVHKLIFELDQRDLVPIIPINSGYTSGVNLGSPKIKTIAPPKVAILVEGGVRAYDAGEVWHLLDHRFGMHPTLLPLRVLERANLSRYRTIVMVEGSYSGISERAVNKLKGWVRNGGNIIACKGANNWLKSQELISVTFNKIDPDTTGREDYEDLSNISGAQVTGGVILAADLDNSNPIGYGFSDREVPVFVNTNTYMELPSNPYAYPLQFAENPLLSGYISEENLERVAGKAAVVVSRYGSGRIVSFGFNPNFRAFWYGTDRLFLNAVFFSDLITSRATIGDE